MTGSRLILFIKSLRNSAGSHIAQKKLVTVDHTASLTDYKESHQIISGFYKSCHLEMGGKTKKKKRKKAYVQTQKLSFHRTE